MVCDLHGVNAGDEIELSREHVVTVVRHHAHHPVASAIVVWERRYKLKEEYHGLPGDKIRDLRLSGVRGDARGAHAAGWPTPATPARPASTPIRRSFQAKILITEMSFIRAQPSPREDPQVRPHAPGRLPRAGRPFQERADHLRHFSTRYHPQEVRRVVEAKLPPQLLDKVRLWL